MLKEVVLMVNGGWQFRYFIDPDNDEDLRYFWRRFEGLSRSVARDNCGSAGMLEVRSVLNATEVGYPFRVA